MGEKTPEAVEITCPGCNSHFRLTPKNGRLPTGPIPCPKCSEPIPVPSPALAPEKVEKTEKDEAAEKTDAPDDKAVPAFGVMSKGRLKRSKEEGTDDGDQAKADEAILRLERLAAQFPLSDPTSTMAGLPGRGGNPFADSRIDDKTTAIPRSALEGLGLTAQPEDEEDASNEPAPLSHAWQDSEQPTTSPRLVPESLLEQLTGEDSEVALATAEVSPEDTMPRGLLSRTDKIPPAQLASSLTETAEHPVPQELVAKSEAEDLEPPRPAPSPRVQEETREHDIKELKAKLAIESKAALQQTPKFPDPPPTQKLPPEPASLTNKPAASSEDDVPAEKPSLAMLFKKARQRDKKSGGELRARLRAEREALAVDAPSQDDKAPEKELIEGIEISVDELSAIVERTTSRPGLPKPTMTNPIWPPPPAITEADRPGEPEVSEADEKSEKAEAEKGSDVTDHSGLFEGFDLPPSSEEEPPPQEPDEVSRRRGKTTTQSMLARLQRRQDRGENVDSLTIGAASERRGSGYIRLPTSEIQEVLGNGDFRLRIQNVIYEPVDRDGLIMLIKSGVLLGAEEIAEADGDWMPVSEHPVFGDLRRKMAAEAHQVLARLGATQRLWAVQAPPTPAPAAPPEAASTPAIDPPPLEVPAPKDSPAAASEVEELTESALIDMSVEPPLPVPEQEALPADSEPISEPGEVEALAEPPDIFEPPEEAEEHQEEPETATPLDDNKAGEAEKEESASEFLSQAPPLSSTVDPVAELDASDSLELDLPKRKGKAGIILAGLAVIIGIGAALFVFGDSIPSLTTDGPEALLTEPSAEPAPALADAMALALNATSEAIPDAFGDESRADAWVRQQIEDDSSSSASEMLRAQWLEGRRSREFLLLFLDLLIQEEDFLTARRVALAGIEEFPGDEDFIDLHRQAIRDDQRLTSLDPLPLIDNAGYQAKGILDEQGQRGFILENEQGRQIFKPAREDWSYGWRAEIAAWRFCELVACHFAIPRTEPAAMSRAFLEGLEGDSQGYESLASAAQWVTLEVDGEAMEVMRGSLEFLPEGEPAPFPIEYRPLWVNWLHAGAAIDDFSAPFSDSIGQLANLADGAFVDGLRAQLGEQKISELARQISSLLIFDYLTNNWERFATSPADYGAANPAIDGILYSRNNGDAFQPRASRRVQGRFEWTTRFSQSTVTTIRGLDPQLTAAVLFPEELAADRARRDVMWSQRTDFLRRLDELIARHGEDEILAFP